MIIKKSFFYQSNIEIFHFYSWNKIICMSCFSCVILKWQNEKFMNSLKTWINEKCKYWFRVFVVTFYWYLFQLIIRLNPNFNYCVALNNLELIKLLPEHKVSYCKRCCSRCIRNNTISVQFRIRLVLLLISDKHSLNILIELLRLYY